jgi:hypothetical protein
MTDCLAQLLDTGNLILVQRESKRVLWQSFDHATDPLLPNMKLWVGLENRFELVPVILEVQRWPRNRNCFLWHWSKWVRSAVPIQGSNPIVARRTMNWTKMERSTRNDS